MNATGHRGILLGICVLFWAQADAAAGVGRIGVSPGWRWSGVRHGPLVQGTFAYGANEWVEISIDPFVGTGLLASDGSESLQTWAYGALLGVRFQWLTNSGLIPCAGLWTGPELVFSQGPDVPVQERLFQAWAGSLGVMWQVSEGWGLSLEYKLVSSGSLTTPRGAVWGGGHWVSLGVTWSP